jgi:hypothetical protein
VKSWLRVVGAVARNRALAAVLVAYGVFSATQNAVWIAMLVYAYERGGAGTAGAVAVAQLLPAALLAPVAAAVADRRSPGGGLVGGYLVQVAGMLATAMAIGLEAPPAAYAGAVIASAAVVWTRPAQTPLVPGLVHNAEELTAANALTGWIESASVVASSAATALLLSVAGPGLVFAVAGVAGLMSVGLAATVRGTGALAVDESAGLAGTLAGFRVLAREPAPRLLVALLGAQWVVIGALDILFVVLAVDVLDRGQGWVGYLSMAYGLGGVLAGLAGMALVGRRRLSIPILGGVVLIAAALALSALSTTAAATVALLAVVGGGRTLCNLATRTLLQRAVPAEMVGRVFGVAEALAMAGLAVGSAVVPLLVAVGGTATAVLGTAAILPLAALWAVEGCCRWTRPPRCPSSRSPCCAPCGSFAPCPPRRWRAWPAPWNRSGWRPATS